MSQILQNALQRLCDIEPRETRITLASFLLAFIIMGAYYIMRPLRDAMASDWSDAQVATLWSLNFALSTLAVVVYGAVASRIAVRRLVPAVYGFFVATFLAFYLGTLGATSNTLVEQGFYVWLSVFALFHISVFWSLMADTFTRPQATRLFAFIGAGASVGALVGPAAAAALAGATGTQHLLLIASVLLALAMPTVLWIQHLKRSQLQNTPIQTSDSQALGGNPFAGFIEFLTSPYLLSIGVFIFLYTVVSSFVYFELKNLLADFTRAERTQIWAAMDLVVNTATLLVAAFLTGRIAKRFGLPTTLASIPVIIGGGLLILAAAPLVSVVIAVQVVRRIGNYAVTRPAREMLFTAVDRETRYKAKPVIDIVIYRGGDMLSGWLFTGLVLALDLSLGAMAAVGAAIAALWAAVGIYLGRVFHAHNSNK
jgi:AAA family ATP:ADP antiporter